MIFGAKIDHFRRENSNCKTFKIQKQNRIYRIRKCKISKVDCFWLENSNINRKWYFGKIWTKLNFRIKNILLEYLASSCQALVKF